MFRLNRYTSLNNVWIGFDVCVLPGVSIGEGSVNRRAVSSKPGRSAVTLGRWKPARIIRTLDHHLNA